MLAVDYDPSTLIFPVIASPKIDGLRCYKEGGRALTRSGKPQPNPHVRRLIENLLPDGVDGELITGDFRQSSSDLRCTWGQPEFTYNLFDYVRDTLQAPFKERIDHLRSLGLPAWCKLVEQVYLHDELALEQYEQLKLDEGYEGVILRTPYSPYKCNRSTLKEGYMLKVKRFLDGEAAIIGFYEQEENQNESYVNELGTTSRSSHQENKVGKNTLGGILVRDCQTDSEFRIGTGLGWTIEWRATVYHNQDNYLGRVIKYKHLPHGNYDVPRNASMQGFREEWDR